MDADIGIVIGAVIAAICLPTAFILKDLRFIAGAFLGVGIILANLFDWTYFAFSILVAGIILAIDEIYFKRPREDSTSWNPIYSKQGDQENQIQIYEETKKKSQPEIVLKNCLKNDTVIKKHAEKSYEDVFALAVK